MYTVFASLLLLAARPGLGAIDLTAQPFQLAGSTTVDNFKLSWSGYSPGSNITYTVLRQSGSSPSKPLATTTGNTFDDYGLGAGKTFSYSVTASKSGKVTDSSASINVNTTTPTQNLDTYDNTKVSSARLKSDIVAQGTYYQYIYNSDSNGFASITQQTSTDGYTFSGNVTVLKASDVCPAVNSNCFLERVTFNMHPTTGEVVMWAHLEKSGGYGAAQVMCASGQPGKTFTFHGTYQPLGHDSRDFSFFADTDNKAYLISSTDVNTNMNIYGLTSNWTYVDSLVNTVLKAEYREAPSMVKQDGTYYLFTSRASGWYPSVPQYITSKNISGTWTASTTIGNIATFSSQSGGVVAIGAQRAMLADRWAANWSPQDGANREYMLPLDVSSTGFATFAWYPSVRYSDTVGVRYGVQAGKILSLNKPISDSTKGSNIALANDGVETDVDAYFAPKSVPFSVTIDLGASHVVRGLDLTTRMMQGSETYYQYNVTGSADGSKYSLLADEKTNTAVGFVSSAVSDAGSYRYVRLSVDKVINTHNGNEADWAVGVHEITVYGQ